MLNYNLEAPKKDILKILCITNVKFNHLLKIFSIDTETTQFNKKQLDAFIQYLNFTKEFTINTDYDDSIFSKYPKRKPFTLEEIINFKKKITTPKRVAATINKKELKALEHQIEATTNILNEFKTSDKTQLISACGTGKTFIAKEVTESIVKLKEETTTLIFVPTLALVLQFYNSWIKSINILEHKKPFVICGDDDLLNDNELKIKREELKFNINTSVEYIISYLMDEQIEHKLLLCTYQSARLIKEAMNIVNKTIDLGIFDEAHKTVGCIDKDFAFALFDENIKINKRLFMTATPKHVISNNQKSLSMNDKSIYGNVAYELSMREAINKGIIKDYQIVVSVIDSTLYKELKPLFKNLTKEQILDELLAVNFIKFIKEKNIKKSISFHGTIKESKRFINNKHIQNHFGKTISHIDGNTSSKVRTKELFHLDFHHEKHISNSRLLSEGIDVPSIEAVCLFNSSKSIVDILCTNKFDDYNI